MQKRNYGIDLLRVVATLMIIVLHILGIGGVLQTALPNSIVYKIAWFMEIVAYCAVNCYALISGYVGVNSKFRLSHILNLWLQVCFYSVIIYCIGAFWSDGITWKTIVKACFPVMTKEYWYFTAYFALYLMMPLLNRMLYAVDKKMAKYFVFLSVVLFVFMPMLAKTDLFFINNGYSVGWLVILYLLGGIIRKYYSEYTVGKRVLLIGYLVSVLLTFITKLVDVPLFELGFLINYNSPTMLLAAVCLVFIFKDLNVNGLVKLTKIFAPFTFGIYLVHVHTFIFDYVFAGNFSWLVRCRPIIFVLLIVAFTILVFIICSMIEFLRIKIFGLCKIATFANWLEEKLNIYY